MSWKSQLPQLAMGDNNHRNLKTITSFDKSNVLASCNVKLATSCTRQIVSQKAVGILICLPLHPWTRPGQKIQRCCYSDMESLNKRPSRGSNSWTRQDWTQLFLENDFRQTTGRLGKVTGISWNSRVSRGSFRLFVMPNHTKNWANSHTVFHSPHFFSTSHT